MRYFRPHRATISATRLLIIGSALLLGPALLGSAHTAVSSDDSQVQAPSPDWSKYSYDVVSIKLLRTDANPDFRGLIADMEPDGISIRSVTLLGLVESAYAEISSHLAGFGLRDNQIVGAPKWATTNLYSIQGKTDASVAVELNKFNPDQQDLARAHMLQAMLADRFKLKAHPENREGPVYYLVIAKSGSKLKQATPGESYPNGPGRLPWQAGSVVRRVPPEPGSTNRLGLGAPIARLTESLSAFLQCPVIDKTGLTGKYDFQLQWTAREGAETGPAADWPPLFTAIQQQLGLKLEPGKGPVPVLVIDHVEMPSGN